MTFFQSCGTISQTSKGKIILKAQEILANINFGLSAWITNVELNDCISFYDINRVSEGFVCALLNTVYGYELSDLNDQQKNQCAIDLGDTHRGIAIQVTSRTDTKKVKETLEKFTKNHFEKTYFNGVKFFIISNSPVKRGHIQWANFPCFNFEKDIIYPKTVIADINKMVSEDIDKLEQIQHIISKYIGTGENRIPDDKQIVENLVRCFDRPAFITPFREESNLPNFEKAIEDTIQAINTGIYCLRDGTEIERIKSRFSISDHKLKEIMREISDDLIALRIKYHEFLKTGDIRRCGCGQEDCGVHMLSETACLEMDSIRKQILNQLNNLSPQSKIHFLEI